jgi:hypothetical protein
MAFTSYEELKAAVAERRKAVLTLEVDLGGAYSQEHEDAKRELATARGLKSIAGGQGFMSDNIERLEQRVLDTKPESPSVWIQYRQIDVGEWALLTKQQGLTPIEQYEKVLPQTFIGVFGTDPTEAADGEVIEPLTTSGAAVSSRGGAEAILSGGVLHSVVQNFMAWQNSGGDVNIRPTRSGRD